MTIKFNHFKTRFVLYPLLAIASIAFLITVGLKNDLSKSDWASWVQAVGAITAIGVAFQIGAKQGKDAISAIVFGYDHATYRRYEAYSVIAQAALEHSEVCLTVYKPTGFHFMAVDIADVGKSGDSLITALQAIPIHEVGTYEAVVALLDLKTNMEYLNKAVGLAKAKVDSFGASPPFYVEYDCTVIHLNADLIKKRGEAFIAAMKARPTS